MVLHQVAVPLFVIVVDYVLRQLVDTLIPRVYSIGRRSVPQTHKHLYALDYADDVPLTAE